MARSRFSLDLASLTVCCLLGAGCSGEGDASTHIRGDRKDADPVDLRPRDASELDPPAWLLADDDSTAEAEYHVVDQSRTKDRYRAVVLKGFRGNAIREPESGRYAWPAMMCRNPDCSGQRHASGVFLFVVRLDRKTGVEITESGRVVGYDSRPTCPSCGSQDVSRYRLPGMDAKVAELRDELRASYTALDAGSGDGHRTPAAIMQDLTNLPQLYLIEP